MFRLMAPTRRAVGLDHNRRPMHVTVRPRGAVYRATRLLTALVVRLRPTCRIAYSLDTTDRRLIETVILPHIARTAEYRRIVFVGVQLYTRHDERAYFSHKDFWTIDVDPRVARYGARQHVVDSIASLGVHFRHRRSTRLSLTASSAAAWKRMASGNERPFRHAARVSARTACSFLDGTTRLGV